MRIEFDEEQKGDNGICPDLECEWNNGGVCGCVGFMACLDWDFGGKEE